MAVNVRRAHLGGDADAVGGVDKQAGTGADAEVKGGKAGEMTNVLGGELIKKDKIFKPRKT